MHLCFLKILFSYFLYLNWMLTVGGLQGSTVSVIWMKIMDNSVSQVACLIWANQQEFLGVTGSQCLLLILIQNWLQVDKKTKPSHSNSVHLPWPGRVPGYQKSFAKYLLRWNTFLALVKQSHYTSSPWNQLLNSDRLLEEIQLPKGTYWCHLRCPVTSSYCSRRWQAW